MRTWSLSDVALARPVTVGMLLIAVVLLGFIGVQQMPLSFLPTMQEPRMSIRVDITRTSPEVLERDVVRPIEEEIAGVRDLSRIQVGSGSWGVRINLDFEPGTDIDARKIEVRDRLERVRPDLPDFVQAVKLSSYSNNDDPVMEMRIASGTDLSEDYYLIEERIVRPIERIPGVARVELDGVDPHELEVAVDLEATARTGVSLDELGSAVRDSRQGKSLGVLRGQDATHGVRTPAGASDPDVLGDVPLRRAARAPPDESNAMEGITFARLREVADVGTHPEDRRRGKRLNGRRAVNLEVFASSGAGIVDVTQDVREAVAEMGNDPALDGIELLVFEDQGESILQTLGDLRDTGLYGGLLGIVVLFLFLRRVSTTAAASISIPLSVMAACAVLFLRGDELNCIVMLGLVIAIGMLIDNAVVIVESIAQQLQRGVPRLEAARKGAREVGFATIASTMSTVIVFLPLLADDPANRASAYLRPLGITFAIGLIASLIVSQTAIPLLMGRVITVRTRQQRRPVLDALSRGYGWLIGRTLRYPRTAVILGLALAGSVYVPFTNLNVKLGDRDNETQNLPIRLQIAGSKSYESVEKMVMVLERALLTTRGETGVDSVSCGFSDHWGNCRVYPAEVFESEKEVEAFTTKVKSVLPEQVGVSYRLGEREGHWRDNHDRNVVDFAIKGEDMAELMRLSTRVAEHLHNSLPADEYDTVTTPFEEGARELHVELDGTRLQRLGLSPDEVARQVSLSFQGLPLGTVRGPRGDLRLRLSVKSPDELGAGVAALRDLRIPVADGREVTLGSLGEIRMARRPWWIQRVDRQTEVRIQVRFHSTDIKNNWKTVASSMDGFVFPPEYSWGRSTKWEREKEESNAMLINLGLCLLLVYAVMASLFESFVQPLGILVTCLLGCFGAPWALYLSGTTLDTTAIVGFFILIGVVVNNGIMLVDKVTQLRAQGVKREDALRQAGQLRLRPILMTMTTTVLGLLPMLIHHPTLAGIYYHAIAIVITGGLLTSTVITLVFLPAAYTLLEGLSTSAGRGFARAIGHDG